MSEYAVLLSNLCKMPITESIWRRFQRFLEKDLQRCLKNIALHQCNLQKRHQYTDKKQLLSSYLEDAIRITKTHFSYFPPAVKIKEEDDNSGGPYYLHDTFFYHPDHAVINSDVCKLVVMHETMPGHHLMFSYMKEHDLPIDDTNIAFIEGWGLYVESLCPKKDRCLYFMSRLIRVVRALADIAYCTEQKNEEQVRNFFRKYAHVTYLDENAEIQRIKDRPGYNVCYVLGEQYFFKLRKLFGKNLTRFHDTILSRGTLPLPIIEKHLKTWLQANRNEIL